LRTYAEERAIINLTRFVNQAAEASDLSRAELANLLGTSRSFVSQVLNGSANMTLKTFGALLWAVGQQVSGVKTEVLGTHAERVDNDNVLRFRVPVSSETRPTGSVADVAIKVVG
jgi:transcriptional regulator with XRE-family HTH domain